MFDMDSVKIQEIQLFRDHLAVFEREQGLQKITVHRLPAEGQPLEGLQGGRNVTFVDPVYSVDSTESEFSSRVLRFCYSSLKTPPSVYDFDMDSGTSVVKKIDTVSKTTNAFRLSYFGSISYALCTFSCGF